MNTQKRNQMIALAAAIILGICAALGTLLTGNKPYAGLESEQLSKVEMQLTPPDVRFELGAEEVEQLTPILRQLTIYRQDDSYTDYAGQTVQVTLTLQDGSTIKVVECNPFLVIDGVGFKAKEESCSQMQAFANQLGKEKGLL